MSVVKLQQKVWKFDPISKNVASDDESSESVKIEKKKDGISIPDKLDWANTPLFKEYMLEESELSSIEFSILFIRLINELKYERHKKKNAGQKNIEIETEKDKEIVMLQLKT